MRCLLLAIIVLISACSGGGGSDDKPKPSIIYYGDSIGRQLSESPDRPDFTYDVMNSRKITELTFTPNDHRRNTTIDYSYDRIYIALGTNDRDMPAAELQLIQLLDGYEDKIICVLPMTRRGEEIEFRRIMKVHCLNTIDPLQHGVYPLSETDSVHLSYTDGGDNISHYAGIFSYPR